MEHEGGVDLVDVVIIRGFDDRVKNLQGAELVRIVGARPVEALQGVVNLAVDPVFFTVFERRHGGRVVDVCVVQQNISGFLGV